MELLTIIYTLSGFIVAAAFVPQIVTLIGDQTGAAAMSLTALAVFSLCTTIGFAYVWVNSGDFFILLDYGLCGIGEITVLILATTRRLSHSSNSFSQLLYSGIPRPITALVSRF